ncbi:hypothetical protein EZV61_00215 [Corallincola luteus]|uniref:Glycosyl transferase family 1 domain-containing protein n=1 Tax=Corallincola luteus TaxID=1775177 RepID=A0ABY2AML2_9GAMM|nr:hypothetical protein [Corallincola luteus]TCI04436.1 hypothetical protein EZV61_00215 [Corallincola luteus]
MGCRLAICVDKSGHGIQKDAAILKAALQDLGISAEIIFTGNSVFQNKIPWRFRRGFFLFIALFFKFLTVFYSKKYHLMVHIQRVNPFLSVNSERNFLIPNQEWYSNNAIPLLGLVDTVLVKTKYAEKIFSRIKSDTRFIGFTSTEQALTYQPPSFDRGVCYFHRAGNSATRGTKTLLKLWQKHPEWPELTVLIGKHRLPDLSIPENVRVITDFLSDDEFESMMREHPFHIHPTMTEGYGLTLSEGLSLGCIPIVTDAPPMNEIASRDFSFLVEATAKGRKGLSELFEVDGDALERVIDQTAMMTMQELLLMASKGQAWHQSNYEMFKDNLNNVFAANL